MAGRYMLTVSSGFGGAISIIAAWEMVYNSGLPTQWWAMIGMPIGLILRISGFIIYFFGLPEHFHIWTFEVPSLPLIMAAYLRIALFIACTGGQISIMIVDFYQGILLMLIFLVLMCFLMFKFEWNDIIAGLLIAPEGKSMLNPFQTGNVQDFSIWYFLIGVFSMIYNSESWQGNSGFNAAAKTPHEAQMAGIIGSWRGIASVLCMLLIPLAAVIVACAISCDNSYLYSW